MKREKQVERVENAIRYMARAINEGWLLSPELADSAIRAAASDAVFPFTDCRKCGAVLIVPAYRLQDPHGGGLSGLDVESYPAAPRKRRLCLGCAR